MHVEYDADEDLHGDLAKGEGTKLSTLPPHITKEQVLQMQRQRNRSDISESALNVIPELQILEKLLQVPQTPAGISHVFSLLHRVEY